MGKLHLQGLNEIILRQNKKIRITKDEFSKKFINADYDLKLEVFDGDEQEYKLSTDNLIKGLIVCSNSYLPEDIDEEEIKKHKSKLENIVRKNAVINIKTMKTAPEYMHLTVNINGNDMYNFYDKSFTKLLKCIETFEKSINNNL